MKLNVAAMHSDLEQEQREAVMLNFKNGKIDILVATDIVARGIDIEDIGTVVNYDVPHDPEDYIHRIGRTARAAATGRAITFVNEKEQGKFHRIETFIERDVEQLPLPERLGKAPVYEPRTEHDGRKRSRNRNANRNRRKGQGGGGRSQGKPAENNPQEPATQGAQSAATTFSEPTSASEGRSTNRRRRNHRRHRAPRKVEE